MNLLSSDVKGFEASQEKESIISRLIEKERINKKEKTLDVMLENEYKKVFQIDDILLKQRFMNLAKSIRGLENFSITEFVIAALVCELGDKNINNLDQNSRIIFSHTVRTYVLQHILSETKKKKEIEKTTEEINLSLAKHTTNVIRYCKVIYENVYTKK